MRANVPTVPTCPGCELDLGDEQLEGVQACEACRTDVHYWLLAKMKAIGSVTPPVAFPHTPTGRDEGRASPDWIGRTIEAFRARASELRAAMVRRTRDRLAAEAAAKKAAAAQAAEEAAKARQIAELERRERVAEAERERVAREREALAGNG